MPIVLQCVDLGTQDPPVLPEVCDRAMPMLALLIRILTKTTAGDEAGR